MVEQHYRWDFIQLSTDTKPTAATSDKVADGSTLYTSDDSKLYVWYKDQWYEKTATGGGGSINVINNLESTSTTDALSANMGRILDGKVADAQDIIYFTQELPEPSFPEENPDGYYMPDFVGKIYLIEHPIKIYYTETDYIDNFSGWWFYSQTSFDEETGYGTYAYTIFKGNGTNNVPEIYVGQAIDSVLGYVNLTFEQVGAGGGDGVITLTSDDFDYPTADPQGIALWNLDSGIYKIGGSSVVKCYYNSLQYMNVGASNTFLVLHHGTKAHIYYYDLDTNNPEFITTQETYQPYGMQQILTTKNIEDSLNAQGVTVSALSANQGYVLKGKITPTTDASAPTTSTQGELGKIFIDTTNDDAYMCVKASGGTYTWKKITP